MNEKIERLMENHDFMNSVCFNANGKLLAKWENGGNWINVEIISLGTAAGPAAGRNTLGNTAQNSARNSARNTPSKLPIPPPSSTTTTATTAKQWAIAPLIYEKEQICKIAWHPLSSTNSHLLILSSNGILRMFNVAQDTDIPEQTFYLTRVMGDHVSGRPSFAPNLEEYEAVSFDIGQFPEGPTFGWACCTVFGLLASGDVVSLCPVLPNEFTVPRDWVHETLQWTRNEWAALGDDVDTKQYYWMSRYLEEILGEEDQDDFSDIFYRPFRQFSLGRSGPCLFSPSLPVLEGDDCTPADIALVSTATGIPILSILVDGVLIVGTLLSPPCPFWLFDQDQQEQYPVITVLEALELSPTPPSHSLVLQNPYAPDTLFVQFPQAVYQVQLEIYKTLSSPTLLSTLTTPPPLLLKKLVESREGGIRQFITFQDHMNGLEFVCVGDGGSVSDVIYPINPPFPAPAPTQTSGPPLDGFDYNLLRDVGVGMPPPQRTLSKVYPDFIDDKSIKKVTLDISETRGKIKQVLESFDKLGERYVLFIVLICRMKVLEHHAGLQKVVLETTEKTVDAYSTGKLDRLAARIHKVKERQRKQTKKLTGVLDLLFDLTQPSLSAAEITWCQELAQLYKQSECFYGPKLHELQLKAKQVQELAANDPNGDALYVPEMLGTRQIRDIKKSLEFEVRELKSLKHKVDKLHIVAEDVDVKLSKLVLS